MSVKLRYHISVGLLGEWYNCCTGFKSPKFFTFKNFGNKNDNWTRSTFVSWFNMAISPDRASGDRSICCSPLTVPAIFSLYVLRDTEYLYRTASVTLFIRSFFSRFKSGGEIVHSDVEFEPSWMAATSSLSKFDKNVTADRSLTYGKVNSLYCFAVKLKKKKKNNEQNYIHNIPRKEGNELTYEFDWTVLS